MILNLLEAWVPVVSTAQLLPFVLVSTVTKSPELKLSALSLAPKALSGV